MDQFYEIFVFLSHQVRLVSQTSSSTGRPHKKVVLDKKKMSIVAPVMHKLIKCCKIFIYRAETKARAF